MKNEYQERILSYLREHRSARISELAALLFVSETTVRRTLNELQRLGLAERTHGGAILHENSPETSILVRIEKNRAEKEKLASTALSLLPDFSTLFLDSSTTALALAERLDLHHKTVVTNNLRTALRLSERSDIRLFLLGGEVRHRSGSAVGSTALRELSDLRFDLMLVSAAALTAEGAFDTSLEQCEIKRQALLTSRRRILLIDSSKFEERGAYRLAPLSTFDAIVSDAEPPFEADNLFF